MANSPDDLLGRVYLRAAAIRRRRLSLAGAPIVLLLVTGVLVAGLAAPDDATERVRTADRPAAEQGAEGNDRAANEAVGDGGGSDEPARAGGESTTTTTTVGSAGESASETESSVPGSPSGEVGRGVFADEIRIAVVEPETSAAPEGRLEHEYQPSDSEAEHGWKVWQKYWNRNGGYHGRRVRFYIVKQSSTDAAQQRDAVERAAVEYEAFAIVGNQGAGIDAAVRHKLITIDEATNDLRAYQEAFPYRYSIAMDATQTRHLASELACAQFAGRPPGALNERQDPTFDYNAPRRWGAIVQTDTSRTALVETYSDLFKACDVTLVAGQELNLTDNQQAIGGTMAKMKAAGVTTIILDVDGTIPAVLTREADNIWYFPEYVVVGGGGIDTDQAGQLMSEAQASHMVGISPFARQRDTRDWYREYKKADPDDDPSFGHFRSLRHVMGGIEHAGTVLNPRSFWRALTRWEGEGEESPGASGSYRESFPAGGPQGPDLTYVDDVSLIWFDTDRPTNGAWRHVWDGRRFALGQMPTGAIPWFTDGRTESELYR